MADGSGVRGWAQALLAVGRAEGVLDRLEDELYTFARAVEEHPELRERLGDRRLDPATRIQVVEDLLSDRAHPQTVAAVSWLVQAGRVRELGAIADAVASEAAESRSESVAEVRTAVELDDDQRQRLTEALRQATGRQVDLKVIVDRSMTGGVIATVGDTVIDGSVDRRLEQMRSALMGA